MSPVDYQYKTNSIIFLVGIIFSYCFVRALFVLLLFCLYIKFSEFVFFMGFVYKYICVLCFYFTNFDFFFLSACIFGFLPSKDIEKKDMKSVGWEQPGWSWGGETVNILYKIIFFHKIV